MPVKILYLAPIIKELENAFMIICFVGMKITVNVQFMINYTYYHRKSMFSYYSTNLTCLRLEKLVWKENHKTSKRNYDLIESNYVLPSENSFKFSTEFMIEYFLLLKILFLPIHVEILYWHRQRWRLFTCFWSYENLKIFTQGLISKKSMINKMLFVLFLNYRFVGIGSCVVWYLGIIRCLFMHCLHS